MLHGCFAKVARGVSPTLTNSLSEPARSICPTMADQTSPCAGSSGVLGSPLMPITVRTAVAHWRAVAAEQDHRRRAVPRDVGAEVSMTCVRSSRGSTCSMSLLPNSRFMKLLAVISPTKPAGPAVAGERQLEEALGERRAERVLHVAAGVALPVGRVQRRVLDDDVRRVADHRVVLPPQDALHLGQVLAGVGVRQPGARVVLGALEHALGGGHAEALAMQQAVADGDVQLEVGRFGQAMHTADLERRHQQPEAGDRDGERIQVHAGDGVQRPLRDVARVARRLVSEPFVDQPAKAAQQEVA